MGLFSAALKQFGPKTRQYLEDAAGEARGMAQDLFSKQDQGYFDLTGTLENPTHTPDVPFERYAGKPKSVERLNPATSKRLLDTSLKGMRQGAHGWYNTQPLHDEFTRVLGPVQGDYDYRRFMDLTAATSPREKVKQNIRRASIPYMREKQGLPIEGLLQPPSKTNPNPGPAELQMPPGYGTLAHDIHAQKIDEIAREGRLDPDKGPKIASFAENLKGNYAPMTMDTHNRHSLFPEDVVTRFNKQKGKNEQIKKSPTKAEYGILEEYQTELADMLGIEPAQWQSSLWTGGAADTNVADPRNFMHQFNDAIKRTAEGQDMTEREAIEAFIKGEIPLASIMGPGAIVGGAAGALDPSGDNMYA